MIFTVNGRLQNDIVMLYSSSIVRIRRGKEGGRSIPSQMDWNFCYTTHRTLLPFLSKYSTHTHTHWWKKHWYFIYLYSFGFLFADYTLSVATCWQCIGCITHNQQEEKLSLIVETKDRKLPRKFTS